MIELEIAMYVVGLCCALLLPLSLVLILKLTHG